MARRYGGRFSPDASRGDEAPAPPSPFAGRQVARFALRGNVLWLLPLPLLIRSVGDPAGTMVMKLAACALLFGGAFLLREGLRAEAAFASRSVARRPAIPRKLFAAALTGAGIGLAAIESGTALFEAVIYAGLGTGLFVLSFGADPLRDKTGSGDALANARVLRAVERAEEHLRAMDAAIRRVGDRRLEGRVERFAQTVRQMCRTVEQDPRDLTPARKYLGVYLMGASDATSAFAEHYLRSRDTAARDDYVKLLDDLEAHFVARRQQMLHDNRADLDIEIQVLRDRLAREGIRP